MAYSTHWLIDRTRPLTEADIDELDRNLAPTFRARGTRRGPWPLAVSLHDVAIHDVKKWFGGADIRVDALVITGVSDPDHAQSFYTPTTTTFHGVHDGERLPIGSGGLLMFHGPASHFLAVSITVSRDRKDTADLAKLLTDTADSAETAGSLSGLLGLAVAAPQVAAVKVAIDAAAKLGDAAFRLLQAATGATIGLYRDTHLRYRDAFGLNGFGLNGFRLGRHPNANGEPYRAQDFSFRYEIVREQPKTSTKKAPSGAT